MLLLTSHVLNLYNFQLLFLSFICIIMVVAWLLKELCVQDCLCKVAPPGALLCHPNIICRYLKIWKTKWLTEFVGSTLYTIKAIVILIEIVFIVRLIWVKFWTSGQMGVILTEKYNRQKLIFIDDVLSRKCFPLCNLKRI